MGWLLASTRRNALAAGVAAVVLIACSTNEGSPSTPQGAKPFTPEELRDSNNCVGCHPSQYKEWSGSMHAYAADDPIFVALNKRMQRDPGAGGTFCVQCHAPMAVRDGRTKDGLDLDTMPTRKGVTCVFCHAAASANGLSNNPVVLTDPPSLAGAIRDPLPAPHASRYSVLHDSAAEGTSGLCGPCHDIVSPPGAAIERTFREWTKSGFGVGESKKETCGSCHMPPRQDRAADVAGATIRTVHDHSMAAVDVAMIDFPERDAQRALVQKVLDAAVDARLCVTTGAAGAEAEVSLTNKRVGHGFPSGSTQDRRAWVEIIGYAGGSEVFSVGKIADDVSVASVADSSLILLRDHDYDADGRETHLFWRTIRFEGTQLAARLPNQPAGDSLVRKYTLPDVDRVTMRLRLRPMDHDLLQDLVESGDLDAEVAKRVTTFTLASTVLEWTKAAAGPCVETPSQ